MVLVDVAAISKSYAGAGGKRIFVTDAVTFSIERGETLGLVGESGSGKSTVARILLGLIEPDAGKVFFDGLAVTGASGAEMRRLRRRMQPVFQDPFAALNPRMRVAEIVTEPLTIYRREAGVDGSRTGLRRQASELMRAVGLDESALGRYPHEFSGGQRQRINIARALALRPELLILDEPVSALDVSVGAQVVNLLRDLQREFHLTYLFISHSMPLVRYLSTNIAVMRNGKLVEIGRCEDICNHPSDEYTKSLLAATPAMA
ncbi:Oligopeptide transport ATP-binding protein OppF [Acidisarcina polymorpha]|uniref:Oligopeptide transport ATP-binding protein OppF n=1 Tax=Acidisarcina polymorpha TaxID=2211140 RepID=A0A2Z5FYR3_9BACT|nr:ATP-binding cassette domain-containing protein [Acidisarcina polymorpha]AXC11607.1 Oligopeptide transport ATP-binding protein OppF [Acidisarcina polymorpha]